MDRQTMVIVVGAIVLLALGGFGAMAYTDGGNDSPMMTMQDGSTMPTGQMTGGMHTMEDGSQMPGTEMTP